jgi:hypothetical protein
MSHLILAWSLGTILSLLLLWCPLLELSAVGHIGLPLVPLLVVQTLRKARSTIAAKLLVLEFPLLGFHITPLALNYKSFVNKLLVVSEAVGKQLILQPIIQALHKKLLLVLIFFYIMWCIARELCEFVPVFTH